MQDAKKHLNVSGRGVPVGLFLPVLEFIVTNTVRYFNTGRPRAVYPWPVAVLVFKSDVSGHLH